MIRAPAQKRHAFEGVGQSWARMVNKSFRPPLPVSKRVGRSGGPCRLRDRNPAAKALWESPTRWLATSDGTGDPMKAWKRLLATLAIGLLAAAPAAAKPARGADPMDATIWEIGPVT